jgi:hypothetical protein
VRGWTVAHIEADGRLTLHDLAPAGVVRDGHLTYPAAQEARRPGAHDADGATSWSHTDHPVAHSAVSPLPPHAAARAAATGRLSVG